jgi:branched-subunit amino acid transport protein
MLFGFAGGAFLPTALLPEIVRKFSAYSPINVIGLIISSVFMPEMYKDNIALWTVMTVAVEALLLLKKRE